jgi:adenosylcobyric acid synthase
VLAPGLDQLMALTGRPTLGVLPWTRELWLDAEDSLALDAPRPDPAPPRGRDGLDITVVRLPRLSNFTDVDALASEPGVRVTFTDRAHDVARADLAIVPGTKATVADLAWLRDHGLDGALTDRGARGAPVLGICGGYQMLGTTIADRVESGVGVVAGLGLLPVSTTFAPDKALARCAGVSPAFGDVAVRGYEIHHGRTTGARGAPLLRTTDGVDEGCVAGAVVGTAWHGLLESDVFRRALLMWVADAAGRDFVPGDVAFADVREAQLDTLGDLVCDHADLEAVDALLDHGAPTNLPVIQPRVRASASEPAGGDRTGVRASASEPAGGDRTGVRA